MRKSSQKNECADFQEKKQGRGRLITKTRCEKGSAMKRGEAVRATRIIKRKRGKNRNITESN